MPVKGISFQLIKANCASSSLKSGPCIILLFCSPCVGSVWKLANSHNDDGLFFFFFLAFSFVLVSSHLNAIKRRESLEEMIWILDCGLERYLKFWLMLLHLEISKSKQAYEVAVILGLPVPTFSSLSTQITFCPFPNSPCAIHSSMGLDFLHTDQSSWFLWPTATVSSPWFLMDGYGLDANIYGSGYFTFLYNLILWDRCCEKILRKKKEG